MNNCNYRKCYFIGELVKCLIKSSFYTFSCISRLSFVMFEVLDSKAAIEFSVLASLPESPRSRLVILSISSTWRRYFKHSLCFVQEDSTYESNNSIRFSNQIFGTFLKMLEQKIFQIFIVTIHTNDDTWRPSSSFMFISSLRAISSDRRTSNFRLILWSNSS